MYNPHRPDEHQVSMLQRLKSPGEHILLQSQIKTSYWIDALQHPAVSSQVRPCSLLFVSPSSHANTFTHTVMVIV